MSDFCGKIEQILIAHTKNLKTVTDLYDSRINSVITDFDGSSKEKVEVLETLKNEFASMLNTCNFKTIMKIIQIFDNEIAMLNDILKRLEK